jgi:CMP-N-acetylneuraminic acid synthetase
LIVIVIPAKARSSRLPNKNMVELNGRPMLDYAIDEAKACKRGLFSYVSTDSDQIAAHAHSRDIPVIRRPESLGGDVPILDVYRHALANMPEGDKVTTVVGLQVDHPDRNVSIDETLDLFERESADRLMSTEADGTKNGAHYVLSRHFVDTGESRKDVVIVDDCTNIHFAEEVEQAAVRLAARGNMSE